MSEIPLLNFETAGSKNLPAIMFLHGFMGAASDWSRVISKLSKDFFCIAVDLPGHGKSVHFDKGISYRMEFSAGTIIRFLDLLEIPKCTIAGYSMGGRLALYLALRHPGRFTKAVLESASPGLRTAKERALRVESDEKLARKLETGNMNEFLEEWYENPLFASLHRNPDFARLLQSRLKNEPKELARSLRDMGTGVQPSLWEELKENKMPLLLLSGEFDRKFRQINREMAVIAPLFRMITVENCGHNIHFENPEAFTSLVESFLSEREEENR